MFSTRLATALSAALALLVSTGAVNAQRQLQGVADGTPAPVMRPTRDGGLAGAYLAARAAVLDGNHRAAAQFFERALEADPGNATLIGNAVFAHAAMGEWERAAAIASDLPADAEGLELSDLVTFVDGIRRGDLIGARAAIEADRGAGTFIDQLALGWIFLGEGDMRRASETFESAATDTGLADIAYTQLALARAAVGDFEGAEAILSGEAYGDVTTTERVVRARAEILMQLDRRGEALEMLDFYTDSVPDPALLALRTRLAATETPEPYDFIVTAEQGVAEVFYAMARIIGADGNSTSLPLLYTRAAYGIHPGHSEAMIFAGRILADTQQYALAAEAFARVEAGDDQYAEAQMGRADALFDAGNEDAAVEVMTQLATDKPELATVHAALGDMLRRTDQCDAAIDAYSDALDLVDTTQERYWFVFYTRAICYERLDNWPPAEADFRQALVLNPDQPSVLNYLGYSLVEQRRSLDEALDMIERAVAGRPDSGYIVDSLGWVLYRLGRFEEAVEPMERAVELVPNDPIINDHLGDVYWMVGRYREAEFQWHRALSFEPEDKDAERIRRKLDVGLYRVLEEEGGVGETQ